MANTLSINRTEPLGKRSYDNGNISMLAAPGGSRYIIRADKKDLIKIGKIIGCKLPNKPMQSTISKIGKVLCLGPDEWLFLTRESNKFSAVQLAKLNNLELSICNVSHRDTAIIICGSGATRVINSGCPLDLDMFPVDACARSVFGKAEIIIIRLDSDCFRIECRRSLSDYVWKIMVYGAKHNLS